MSLFLLNLCYRWRIWFSQASYVNNSTDKSNGGSYFLNSTGKKTNFLVEMPPCPVGGVSDWLTIAYS